MKKIKIDNEKMYSAREAFQFIPEIASEPSMRRFIEEDMLGENFLEATVQRIGKQKRYFVPGRVLLKIAVCA